MQPALVAGNGHPIQQLADLGAGDPGRVERAHHCPNAGAADPMGPQPEIIEQLENEQMRETARTAAAQRQTDAGTPFVGEYRGRQRRDQ